MERRLFLTGLLGVVGIAGIATVLPRQAQALAAVPLGGPAPKSDSILPKLPELGEPPGDVDEGEELDEGFELVHSGRRRRRMRRWRRICRRDWYRGYWRRRCHRRPFWIWFWI